MKRKLIGLLLCVAMTATMLAGCGSKGGDAPADAPAADAPAEAPAESGDDAEEIGRASCRERV